MTRYLRATRASVLTPLGKILVEMLPHAWFALNCHFPIRFLHMKGKCRSVASERICSVEIGRAATHQRSQLYYVVVM